MLNIFIANTLQIIHILLLLIMISSYYAPSGEWLKYFIIIVCLIKFDWYDGDNQCSITSLEAKFRNKWKPGFFNDDSPEFFRPLVNKLLKPLNIELNKIQADNINNIVVLVAIIIGFIRYCIYKNISFIPKDKASYFMVFLTYFLIFIWIINKVVITKNISTFK